MSKLRHYLPQPTRQAVMAVVYSLALGLLAPNLVWAQPPGAEPPEEKNWGLQYLLVLIMVGVGVFVVCRPAGRKDDLPRQSQ